MPRTRNNKYERNRQKRTYIKKIQQSIDDLKIQIRQISKINSQDGKKIQELNMKISVLESDLAHSEDNEKKLKERLELLTNEFNEFKINSESLNNSFSLELFKIKDKYGLLNW
jgi:chromosome segregation ATPase